MNSNTTAFGDKPSPSYTHLIPSENDWKNGLKADNSSILSGTTVGASELAFTPSKSLHVQTLGHSAERFPTPTLLQTFICNPDGSIAYRSTRPKRTSENCILTDADDRELIGTEFASVPGRSSVMHLLDGHGSTTGDIKSSSKVISRTQKFIFPDGREFSWEYKRGKGFGAKGKTGTALVLTLGTQRLAALFRNLDSRAPGKLCNGAGNGGELVLADIVGEQSGIAEEVVIASCLMMLKREFDCRWYTIAGTRSQVMSF